MLENVKLHEVMNAYISDLLLWSVEIWFFFPARHVVEEEKDVKRAMEFLHECDLLKIEDILPFFPDFVTIDHFKVNVLDLNS